MGDTRNIHTGLICSVSETDNTLRSLYSLPRRPGPSRRQQSNCKRRSKTVSTEPWHARVCAMLKWHDIITLQILFLRGISWWRKVEKTFCFAPRGWVLLVLKIHQENKVLGVYKFFERVYSASFLLHTQKIHVRIAYIGYNKNRSDKKAFWNTYNVYILTIL